ncbi:hypothetical protein RN001_001990 [Aquatica leii]|uniref:YqaJ viral recombinase domain-containing protein n=1 Tax=Aquatica leii TaxID=1421715 RepID=A0AAN7SLL3_9COLE|nr:hypothetical protein RN001_001990 [Aquatica leii]
MAIAAKEERLHAVEQGNIKDEMPYITVIVDRGWAKRSYGHGFSSLSGVALTAAVRSAITKSSESSIKQFCEDLRNIPNHVFGCHLNCRTVYCTRKENNEENLLPLMESTPVLDEIKKCIILVVRKAHKLTKNVTTNHAERYMSLVAKFTGGKRTNLVQRGSYQRRCYGAGLSREKKVLSKLYAENIDDIQEHTVGQHDNMRWFEARRKRLTGSNFGRICRRRPTTPCHNLVTSLLYSSPNLITSAILYGKLNEKEAIAYETKTKKTVTTCGFFVLKVYPYLEASPDGLLLEDNGFIEVKCLYSIKDKKIRQAIQEKAKNICVKNENNVLQLKNNHFYYYQIQGQLNILNRQYCDLILYTNCDLEIIRIEKDEQLWNNMLEKLKHFFINYLLPELADPRIPRGLKARDF